MTTSPALAPHRLILSAEEFAQLVGLQGVDLPPQWHPTAVPARVGSEEHASLQKNLVERGVLIAHPAQRDDEAPGAAMHPSVAVNLGVLARPQAMLTTTAHIGSRASKSLHAVAGAFGASLFQLDGGKFELSLFQATGLGEELVRAVPPEPEHGFAFAGLFAEEQAPAPTGVLPFRALEEVGLCVTLRDGDPPGVGAVIEALSLSAEQGLLARRLADETDGLLTCDMLGRTARGPVADRFVWLHASGGWTGLRPDTTMSGERMVQLVSVERAALGVWAAGFLSLVLSG